MNRPAVTHSIPKDILLLGITGAVAAAWLPARIYSLRRNLGLHLHVLMTRSAAEFITPYSAELLSGNKVFVESCERTVDTAVPHVELPARAAAFLIMPATAAILASCAAGACDNLVSLAVCATPPETPVIFVPSMNPVMWENVTVQQNVARLKRLGYYVIDPGPGEEVAELKTVFSAMASHDVVESILNGIISKHGDAVDQQRLRNEYITDNLNLTANWSDEMSNIYQVGGIDEQELYTLVERLQKGGASVEVVADESHRFSLSPKEFAVRADEKGVIGLLSNQRVNVGGIRWHGSMRNKTNEVPSVVKYPGRMPLTPGQVKTLEDSGTDLYRVGNVSYRQLQQLVEEIKQNGIEAEIVKVAGNRFVGEPREFTLKTSDKGILGLLSDRHIDVGVC